MTFSERMVAGSIGGSLLSVGVRLARSVGAEAFIAALGAVVILLIGGVCVFGAITLGEER